MFRVVKVSGKQHEVQPLLDQLMMPGLTDQGALVKAGLAVLAKLASRTASKSNRCDVSPQELGRFEKSTDVCKVVKKVVLCQNMQKMRNK